MKKKIKWSLALLAIAFLLSGCGKEPVPVEDYVQSNPSTQGMNGIMKSDTGYYYSTTSTSDTSSAKMSLHYFDEASGQSIYLCCKPECRHDGDAFCTATSDKYSIKGACFYGGSLYLSTLEATGTEYLLKLLRMSPDGSERTELSEVAKVEIGTKPYLGYEENFSVAILDGMVYLQTTPTVFACTLEEFLKGGQPPFEPVYNHQDVEYLKYHQ